MKLFTNKEVTKKIIVLIIAVIVFNLLAPMYHILADDGEDSDESFAGKLFRPIMQLIAGIGDLAVMGLQSIFIGNGDITIDNPGPGGLNKYDTYSIRYGPALIFSNVIPGLDANFINPKYTDEKGKEYNVSGISTYTDVPDYGDQLNNDKPTNFNDWMKRIFEMLDEDFDDNAKNQILIRAIAHYGGSDKNRVQISIYYGNNCITVGGAWDIDDDEIDALSYMLHGEEVEADINNSYTYYEFVNLLNNTEIPDSYDEYKNKDGNAVIEGIIEENDFSWYSTTISTSHEDSFISDRNKYESELIERLKSFNIGFNASNITHGKANMMNIWTWEYNGEQYRAYYLVIPFGDMSGSVTVSYSVRKTTLDTYANTGETKVSTSYELRDTISTWYKALRSFALVGLLSVLVYIGIRILISSTGQEKAKYKKMIGDWVAAICILFILHYIMAFTMTIVDKVSGIFAVNVVGENGEDVLMSTVRNKINSNQYSTLTTFTNLIIYLALIIYTVIFTIHYLKRLVYLAFFTMIAPLIALTYPIDKIKDGQAQAFSMWLKEYIFNALIPVIHLVIYSIFVGSAINFAISNPIYAIVCIGFLMPAEKFFKKMFGFDKAASVGQLGAAAGGALVMNAINKMGQASGRQAAGKASGGGGGSSTPRTSGSGYIAAPGTTPGGANGGAGTSGGSGGAGTSGGSGGAGTSGRSGSSGTPLGSGSSGSGSGSTRVFDQDVKSGLPKPKTTITGIKAGVGGVAGRYFNRQNGKNMLKGAGRMVRKGAVGALGAGALGTVGLAAGIATGDFSNALKYAGAGAFAGYKGANSIGNKLTDIEKETRETFKENKWGTDEYNTRKQISQLSDDREFIKSCSQLGLDKQGRDEAIRKFHANGITDPESIKNAMYVQAKNGVSQDEIVAASKINQTLSKSYWGQPKNRDQFKTDLMSKGVSKAEADKAVDLISNLKGDLG